MFISSEEYATSANLTSTTLTIVISETSYYIKNRQLPIAKVREIIFHNLLFTVVCIEIFRLIFLLCKLTTLPIVNFIMEHCQKKNEIMSTKTESVDCDTIADDHDITTDNHDTITDNHDATSDNHSITTTITKDYDIVQINL
jgi:hypothetical protein